MPEYYDFNIVQDPLGLLILDVLNHTKNEVELEMSRCLLLTDGEFNIVFNNRLKIEEFLKRQLNREVMTFIQFGFRGLWMCYVFRSDSGGGTGITIEKAQHLPRDIYDSNLETQRKRRRRIREKVLEESLYKDIVNLLEKIDDIDDEVLE